MLSVLWFLTSFYMAWRIVRNFDTVFRFIFIMLGSNVGKHTFGYMRPEKIQIRLRIRAVWSESLLGAFLDSRGCEVSLCWQRRLTSVTETRLYSFDPLKPHFYTVIWGLQGYTSIFLFLLRNIDCGYSLELPHWGGSNEYQNLCFEQHRNIDCGTR